MLDDSRDDRPQRHWVPACAGMTNRLLKGNRRYQHPFPLSSELISKLDQWLKIHRPDYHASLQSGVSEADLAAFESQFSLKLPITFRQLYQWKSGQDPGAFEALQFNRMWMTLADIAEVKDMMDGMIGYDFEDPRYWRRGWVPFLGNGGGSYLCLDLAAEDGGQPGQVLEFWKADEDRPVIWADIQAWLADLVRSMEDGALEIY